MLLANTRGGYSFLKGLDAFSSGVVAGGESAIVHARLAHPVALRAGFERIDAWLRAQGRPRQALCAVGLRSPVPFSLAGFADFNAAYVRVLAAWDVLVDGVNPVARTNVAPALEPPAEPSLYSFAYTVPAGHAPRTFLVSGAGELPEGSLDPSAVVRKGETSRDALAAKARHVLSIVDARLHGLGARWEEVTVTGVYTAHGVDAMLGGVILARIGAAKRHGITWHYARPPLAGVEFEMDARGCGRELVIPV